MASIEYLARINSAMEAADGDIQIAADLLQTSYGMIQKEIASHPELSGRWSNSKDAPSEADVLAKSLQADPIKSIESPPPPIPASQMQVAEAVDMEMTKLKKGLGSLGLTEKEAELALQCAAFNDQHFKEGADIIGGTLHRTAMKLQTVQDKIGDRLNSVWAKIDSADVSSEDRAVLIDEEKNLLRAFKDIVDQVRQVAKLTHDGKLTMALIRMRFGKKGQASIPKDARRSKGGYTGQSDQPPIDVQ